MANHNQLSVKTLDKIIDEMTKVVETSKDEIFQISEGAIEELEHLKNELSKTKLMVEDYIKVTDKLEKEVKHYRNRLSIVSSQFDKYSEADIRDVYEKTHQLQTDLAIKRQEEKLLREKRDDLERRIVRLTATVEHAGKVGQKVSVALSYLYDDFSQVNELVKDAKEKQEFGLKIIEVQETERQRLSREIHDGPAQMLANILIRSEIVDLAFREGDAEQALKEIKQIRGNIRTSLTEVRKIIYNLRPMALDDLGLFPTIKKYIATQSDYYNIDINLKIYGDEYRPKQAYEVAIFRLLQESLQNALKHAEATRINIVIEQLSDKITFIIKDNGKGFDKAKKKEGSFGLVGMKERVELLNGTVVINSEIGKGTAIKFEIPYEN